MDDLMLNVEHGFGHRFPQSPRSLQQITATLHTEDYTTTPLYRTMSITYTTQSSMHGDTIRPQGTEKGKEADMAA